MLNRNAVFNGTQLWMQASIVPTSHKGHTQQMFPMRATKPLYAQFILLEQTIHSVKYVKCNKNMQANSLPKTITSYTFYMAIYLFITKLLNSILSVQMFSCCFSYVKVFISH